MPIIEIKWKQGNDTYIINTIHVSQAVCDDPAAIARIKKETEDSMRCQYCKRITLAGRGHRQDCPKRVGGLGNPPSRPVAPEEEPGLFPMDSPITDMPDRWPAVAASLPGRGEMIELKDWTPEQTRAVLGDLTGPKSDATMAVEADTFVSSGPLGFHIHSRATPVNVEADDKFRGWSSEPAAPACDPSPAYESSSSSYESSSSCDAPPDSPSLSQD